MKYKTTLFWIIACCCMFFILQYAYRFHFYYIEQLQLFLFTKQYALDTMGQPGGVALYLSRFFVQFYVWPTAGALLTTCLLVGIGLLLQNILRRITPASFTYLFSLLPSLAFLHLHTDINYRLQGTVAYLLMLSVFCLYIRIGTFRRRCVAGGMLLPLLYGVAGPVATLLAVAVVVWEWLHKQPGWYLTLTLFAEVALIAWLSLRFAWQGEWRMILLPDAYYEPLLQERSLLYAWFLLPVSLWLAWLLRNTVEAGGKRGAIVFSCQLLPLLVFFAVAGFSEQTVSYKNREQDHYLRAKQWDTLLATFPAGQSDWQTINVRNLALASRGELGDKMFGYYQDGVKALMAEWDNTLQQAIALSDICYQIGDIALAQKFAFEGYISSMQAGGGNIRFLQRLTETNIICGAYPVAEKYITLLEHTWYYSEWAKEHRQFLYNDLKVEQDPVFGGKRKALVNNGQYAVSTEVMKTLEQLAVNNPSNQIAIQYLAAFYLLNKDLTHFKSLFDTYYRTKVWPSLSVSHQEAIVVLEQNSPSSWGQNGVSLKVEQRFGAFSQDMTEKRSYMNFQDVMKASYGDTYWYYLMFKK